MIWKYLRSIIKGIGPYGLVQLFWRDAVTTRYITESTENNLGVRRK
jgi:hypothetical protein